METIGDDLTFAEGLRWRDGHLWYSDMYSGEVHCWSPRDGDQIVLRIERSPSGLGWSPDGALLVVSMQDRHLLKVDHEGCAVSIADLSSYTGHPINDMVVDSDGRAYIGSFGFDLNGGGALSPGPVLVVDPDGSHGVAADDLLFPNGMVLLDGEATLVVAETFGGRLTAYSRGANGALHDRRVWADLPDGVSPDGICLDADGAIWAASPTTSECLRVRRDGKVTDRITTADAMAIACALGGEDGRTLFISTSPTLAPEEARRMRGAKLVSVHVEVPGSI